MQIATIESYLRANKMFVDYSEVCIQFMLDTTFLQCIQ